MPMSKKKNKVQKKKHKTNSSKKIIGLTIVSIIIIAIFALIIFNLIDNKKPKRHKISKSNTTITNDNKTINSCKRQPAFLKTYGLRSPYAIDTRQGNESMGIKIVEASRGGKVLQLPSWDDFGYIGLYTIDNLGNIYTSPTPHVSIDINPPKEQNKILVIDTKTGIMSEFLKLSSKNTPDAKNPFGVFGLEFDCSTNSLYATSISGSTHKDESGKIYQINTKNKKIISSYSNIDVLGIGLFSGAKGKRIYLGLARKPEIYSIGLNDSGGFNNDLKFEFSLLNVPGGGYHKAHRIKFKNGIMTLKTREFSYSLIAASSSMRTIYTFKYNLNNNKWDFIELVNET